MRKVSREVISAFLAGKPKRNGNTTTDGVKLYLYGNKIAEFIGKDLAIYDGGFSSATTKERLNSLLQLARTDRDFNPVAATCVFQKNYQWFVRFDNGSTTEFRSGTLVGAKR
jgi:hypothetical protein